MIVEEKIISNLKSPCIIDVSVEGEGEDQKIQGITLSAALKIQKIWRGFMARRATRRRKLQEMLLIGTSVKVLNTLSSNR